MILVLTNQMPLAWNLQPWLSSTFTLQVEMEDQADEKESEEDKGSGGKEEEEEEDSDEDGVGGDIAEQKQGSLCFLYFAGDWVCVVSVGE